MPTYGLTTDGLIVKTLPVLRAELASRLRDVFGASVKSGEDLAIIGQITGIVSEIAALVWEQLEVVNSSQDPDKATGAALDALCILTGTTRPQASYSTVTLSLTGDDGIIVPEGNQVKTASTDVIFETIEDVELETADAWVGATAYAIGDRVTNGGNVYQCITAGTSDVSGGPTTTEESIEDATVDWTYVGEGTAVIDVVARASVTGPITAFARDLTVINTNVAGWNSVINLDDSSIGRDIATDEELRQLREAGLATSGSTPIDALRAELLEVALVEAVTVFVNNSDVTDADGMPPHSVEALIRGPDVPDADFDQSIWNALLAGVAAGIQTHGAVVGTASDSQGNAHTMRFNRPEELPIYVIMDVVVEEDEFPTDGADLIAEAISLWGEEQATGKNAVASKLAAVAFEEVSGILDVTSVKIGTAPAPTLSTTIPVSLRQLATYSTVNITINVTYGTP